MTMLVVTVAANAVGASGAGAAARCGSSGCITVLEVNGLIDAIVADQIDRALDDVEKADDFRGLVLRMDSAGVVISDDEFAKLATRIKNSSKHVAVWVGPTGAEASGAAAELVRVIPDSSAAQGATVRLELPQRLPRDVFGDLIGANADLVGKNLGAKEAHKAGLVNRVAPTLGDFLVGLKWVETKVVKVDGQNRKEPVTVVQFVKLTYGVQMLHTAASPPVAYLAFAIGLGLLLFEFFTAGIGIVGVVGSFCLLLGSYGLGSLPVRPVAVALLVLGVIACAIDVQPGVPRFWTGAGLVMFWVGSWTLYDGVSRPWTALIVGCVAMTVAMVSGMPSMVRARFGTPTIGRDWMIGEMGVAVSTISPEGIVEIKGARWRARTHRLTPIDRGEPARVVSIDGLMIEVEPESGGAVDYREMRKSSVESDAQSADS